MVLWWESVFDSLSSLWVQSYESLNRTSEETQGLLVAMLFVPVAAQSVTGICHGLLHFVRKRFATLKQNHTTELDIYEPLDDSILGKFFRTPSRWPGNVNCAFYWIALSLGGILGLHLSGNPPQNLGLPQMVMLYTFYVISAVAMIWYYLLTHPMNYTSAQLRLHNENLVTGLRFRIKVLWLGIKRRIVFYFPAVFGASSLYFLYTAILSTSKI